MKLLFSLFWIIGFLLPSFIRLGTDVDFSEHRFYIPMIGVLIFLIENEYLQNISFHSLISRVVISTYIIVFSILTFFHCRDNKDGISFWKNAIKTSPSNAFNYNNLGAVYFLEDNYPDAEKYFLMTLKLNPAEPLANSNLGIICLNSGRFKEAEKYFQDEIHVNPTNDNAYYHLGLVYYNLDSINESVNLWERTIQINPLFVEAYSNLYKIYFAYNQIEKANNILSQAAKNGFSIQ